MEKSGERMRVTGSLPAIIRNDAGLYIGDLRGYLKVIFRLAPNIGAPYHNLRHMLHVLYLCHHACEYYIGRDQQLQRQTARQLLIAAIFHDFNHTGRNGNDDLNIQLALRGLRQYILAEDRQYEFDIAELISVTEFPYTCKSSKLSLSGQILREADSSQLFSAAWIQQITIGLGTEMSRTPIEMLQMQESFLRGLVYTTEWGRNTFGQTAIESKIAEVRELLLLLE